MVVVDDIASDPGFAHWRQFALDKGFSCAFAVPVIGKSDAPDLVLCGYHRELGAYPDPVQELLAEFSHRLRYALESAKRRHDSDLGAQRVATALHGTLSENGRAAVRESVCRDG